MKELGAEVAERGFTALKQNIYLFDRDQPAMWMPGFTATPGWPELNVDRDLLRRIDRQLTAFREGAGEDIDLLLDTNFNFKADGYRKVAQVCDAHDMMWLELDMFDPDAMALVRAGATTSIASLRKPVWTARVPAVFRETLDGRRHCRRALERHSRGA